MGEQGGEEERERAELEGERGGELGVGDREGERGGGGREDRDENGMGRVGSTGRETEATGSGVAAVATERARVTKSDSVDSDCM